MPSKSKKQAKLMRAAAANKAIARKTGVPQKVAKEFVKSDAKRKRK
jgi:transposase